MTEQTATAIKSVPSSTSNAPMLPKGQRELWVCDVCKTAKFEDFDEACRHEEQCMKQQQQHQQPEEKQQQTQPIDAKNLHPLFAKHSSGKNNPATTTNHKKTELSTSISKDASLTTKPKNGSRSHNDASKDNGNSTSRNASASQTSNESTQSTKPRANSKRSRRSPFTAETSISSSSENSIHSVEFVDSVPSPTKKRKSNPTKTKHTINGSLVEVAVVAVKPASKISTQKKQQSNVAKAAASKAKADKSSKNSTNHAPLAAIFQLGGKHGKLTSQAAKSLMNEQLAVELQAKRHLERERERERQRKRQELFFSKKSELKTPTSYHDNTANNSKFSCPRFPVPSFVYPQQSNESNTPKPETSSLLGLGETQLLEHALLALRKSLPYVGKPALEFTQDLETEFPYSCETTNQANASETIQAELAKILVADDDKVESSSDNFIWTDKYLLQVQGICGSRNNAVAKELISFVRAWMVERDNANKRMAERQAALQKQKKASKKKKPTNKYKDDDEDLWIDSDDDDNNNRLTSLCLVEGPVGSCKTSLIHAIARHCGCQVLELNTSDKRGSVNIKRALEEATQSHSSLDMLKRREANLFAKQELVDSDDDEVSDKEDDNGSSLTVILIDEVDNVFESCGDNGFWSALNDLTRKARCPIFLTANAYPKGLHSTALAVRHVKTELPSPIECVSKFKQVMKQEGISCRNDESEGPEDDLIALAELCGCDIRRMMLELQLFACVHSNPATRSSVFNSNSKDASQRQDPVADSSKKSATIFIDSVSPKTVPSDQFSSIVVKGKNFRLLMNRDTIGAPVKVLVGDQPCPAATVVDDETIVAVCPPWQQPANVDKFGMRKLPCGTRKMSLESRFAPLSLHLHHTLGSFSVSSTRFQKHTLVDDTCVHVASACNIEYSPTEPPRQMLARQNEDDSECEFGDGASERRVNWLLAQSSYLNNRKVCETQIVDRDVADRLLTEALNSSTCATSSSTGQEGLFFVSPPQHVAVEEYYQLESIARGLELASDAELINSHVGIPFLSGASPGFGYRFTPEGSASSSKLLSRHGNSTHCSEERLFTLGWKDSASFYGNCESYFFAPQRLSARERSLLKLTEATGRRRCALAEDVAVTGPSPKEPTDEGAEENNDLTMWSPLELGKSEEDFFLPRPIPPSLLSLSTVILDSQRSLSKFTPHVKSEIFHGRKKDRMLRQLDLLHNTCPDDVLAQMNCLGFGRCNNSILPDQIDNKIFLEYIPMLRNMAVCEQAAGVILDGEPLGTSSHRRTTRKSARKGRSHYFETVNPHLRWEHEGMLTATEVGVLLAECMLRYTE